MVKIIITLRNEDMEGIKQHNERAVESITNHANKFFNCESTEVIE